MTITVDNRTRRTFTAAVKVALDEVFRFGGPESFEPIWAYLSEKTEGTFLRFAAGNPDDLGECALWQVVDRETFGNLTGDYVADAHGIEANCYCDAVEDCLDEFTRRNREVGA